MTASAWFVELLLDVSLKAILLAVVIGVALGTFRVRSASVRHRVWTAVLAAMLALPLLIAATPAVPLPVWAYPDLQFDAAPALAAQEQDSEAATAPVATSDLVPPPTAIISAASSAAKPAGDIVTSEPVAPLPPPRAASPPRDGRELVMRTIAALYVLGAWLFLGRLIYGLFAAQKLVWTATPVSLSTDQTRIVGSMPVFASPRVRVPFTVGWLRPTIVLPSDWSTWSESMLAAVLTHEQTHIRRGDTWVALAAQVNRGLYWFHPLAWFLCRRLTTLAETACDDAVIESLGDRATYARHLLDIAGRLATSPRRLQPFGVAMARPACCRTAHRSNPRRTATFDAPRQLDRIALSVSRDHACCVVGCRDHSRHGRSPSRDRPASCLGERHRNFALHGARRQ